MKQEQMIFSRFDTKVVLMFEPNKTNKTTYQIPKEACINWYLVEMDIVNGTQMLVHREWYWDNRYRTLWEIKSVVYAIISFLSWALEYDDLFYTLQDNKIYIDRLGIKEQVR